MPHAKPELVADTMISPRHSALGQGRSSTASSVASNPCPHYPQFEACRRWTGARTLRARERRPRGLGACRKLSERAGSPKPVTRRDLSICSNVCAERPDKLDHRQKLALTLIRYISKCVCVGANDDHQRRVRSAVPPGAPGGSDAAEKGADECWRTRSALRPHEADHVGAFRQAEGRRSRDGGAQRNERHLSPQPVDP